MYKIFIFISATILLISSQQGTAPEDPAKLLKDAQTAIDQVTSISYTRHLVFDNAFIGSADTLRGEEHFYRNEASPIGYDFVAESEKYTFYLIGALAKDVHHNDHFVVSSTAEETKADFEDLESSMIVSNAPFYQLHRDEWEYALDTVFQEQPARMYAFVDFENQQDSVHYLRQARLFLNSETGQPLGHQAYLTANGVLHQVITCWYENYEINQREAITFTSPEGYTEMSNEAYDAGREAGVLSVGDTAPDFSARTISGEEFTLSDYRGKRVLLDFSFVGCRGCEMAMKEFSKPDFQLPGDMVGVYLSYLNTTAEIKKHFTNKEMPFLAIPKAEGPNKDYGVFVYPTFFVIDEKGVIERVELGFEEGFGASL